MSDSNGLDNAAKRSIREYRGMNHSRPTVFERGTAVLPPRHASGKRPIRHTHRATTDLPQSPKTDGPEWQLPSELLRKANVITAGAPWTGGNKAKSRQLKQWPGPYPSFELQGPDPHTDDPNTAVAFWLAIHRAKIVEAETTWRIDRRAIAGAIAWEALQNASNRSLRAEGPGKVHVTDYFGKTTWAESVENAGRLQVVSISTRRERLRDPEIAIDYIGAILDTIARVGEHYGWSLRNDPTILTYAYHAKDLSGWLKLVEIKQPHDLWVIPNGYMGEWVGSNLTYLERSVGTQTIFP